VAPRFTQNFIFMAGRGQFLSPSLYVYKKFPGVFLVFIFGVFNVAFLGNPHKILIYLSLKVHFFGVFLLYLLSGLFSSIKSFLIFFSGVRVGFLRTSESDESFNQKFLNLFLISGISVGLLRTSESDESFNQKFGKTSSKMPKNAYNIFL
jgi:hypothetical protein